VKGRIRRLFPGSEQLCQTGLRTLTDRVNSSRDLIVVLSNVLEGVSALYRCADVWIALPSTEYPERYSVLAARGEGAPAVGSLLNWERGSGEVWLLHLTEEQQAAAGALAESIQFEGDLLDDCYAAPMEEGGSIVGLLCIGCEDQLPYSTEEKELLRIVCNHAGLAISNSGLTRKVQSLTEELQDRVNDQTRSLITANERLRQLNEETERLATVDGLTGLHNHRYFWQRLCEETARARRFRRKFSLLFMDVDGLKEVNDVHGHLVGDRLLAKFGEVIASETRSCDVSARYGGDEFVVLLAEAGPDAAAAAAGRIRKRAEGLRIVADSGVQVTGCLSLGSSSYPEDGKSEWELVHAADQHAYEDKRGKRKSTLLGALK
jgi:diguanylate cyclase (GGDEF)-like protein